MACCEGSQCGSRFITILKDPAPSASPNAEMRKLLGDFREVKLDVALVRVICCSISPHNGSDRTFIAEFGNCIRGAQCGYSSADGGSACWYGLLSRAE